MDTLEFHVLSSEFPIEYFMIIGITGNRALSHRPEEIEKELNVIFDKHQPNLVITGVALGFDQLVAKVCISRGIPFLAAVPYAGQAEMWNSKQQKEYVELLEKASEIKIVSDGGYAIWKLFKRNEWIVNNSDMIVAYAMKEDGGAASCCIAAEKAGKPVEKLFVQGTKVT